MVFATETITFTVAFLPFIFGFTSSAEYMVEVMPAELLYPLPGLMRVNLLIELKLWSESANKVTVVLPDPVMTAPVTA